MKLKAVMIAQYTSPGENGRVQERLFKRVLDDSYFYEIKEGSDSDVEIYQMSECEAEDWIDSTFPKKKAEDIKFKMLGTLVEKW